MPVQKIAFFDMMHLWIIAIPYQRQSLDNTRGHSFCASYQLCYNGQTSVLQERVAAYPYGTAGAVLQECPM